MKKNLKKSGIFFLVVSFVFSYAFGSQEKINISKSKNTNLEKKIEIDFKKVMRQSPAIWQPIGPDGGKVNYLNYNSENKNEIYALVNGKIFKSIDGGQHWQRFSEANFGNPYQIKFDPFNKQIIYVLFWTGLYKSGDGGQTWNFSRFGSNYFSNERMAIDPINSNNLYVVGYFSSPNKYKMALFKSIDGGGTWEIKTFGPESRLSWFHDVAVDPLNPKIVYLYPITPTVNTSMYSFIA